MEDGPVDSFDRLEVGETHDEAVIRVGRDACMSTFSGVSHRNESKALNSALSFHLGFWSAVSSHYDFRLTSLTNPRRKLDVEGRYV
jgi:hypothetical protein